MRSIKFNPFTPVAVKTLERAFDELFTPGFTGSTFQGQKPLVNVVENTGDFKLQVAAPGLNKEDFKISIEKDQLIVSAKQETKTEETEEKYSRREFNYTSFKRSFYLPETVDGTAIEAAYENGILTLTLPKKKKRKRKDLA